MFEHKLYNFIGRFVPGEYEDVIVSELIRARFFVLTVLLFFIGTMTVFSSWLIVNKGQVLLAEWSLILSSLIVQFFCLTLFISRSRLDLASKMLVWVHYVFILILVLISNGIHSPFVVAFIFMPVFCGFLINVYHCKLMLVLSLMLLVALSLCDQYDIQLLTMLNHNADSLRMILFVVGMLLVIATFASYEITVSALMNALVDEKNKFLNLAEHDALTGLLSYQAFERILDANIRRGTSFAVFYIDINNFKVINMQHGHKEGDRVLQQIAARIGNAIRNDDVVARAESDEFIVLINDITENTDLEGIADTIRQSVSVKLQLSTKNKIDIPQCSIGYSDTLSGSIAKSTLLSLAKASLR